MDDCVCVSRLSGGLETVEISDGILIRHTSGINCENYIIAHQTNGQVRFSIFKIDGVWFISINGEHVIDYKKFADITSISMCMNGVVLENYHVGKIHIDNANIDLVKRMLLVMQETLAPYITRFYSFRYYLRFLV
jgi:hypothetical protein